MMCIISVGKGAPIRLVGKIADAPCFNQAAEQAILPTLTDYGINGMKAGRTTREE